MLFLSLAPCRVWWNQQWKISKCFYEPHANLDQKDCGWIREIQLSDVTCSNLSQQLGPQFFSTKCCTGHEDFWTWARIEAKSDEARNLNVRQARPIRFCISESWITWQVWKPHCWLLEVFPKIYITVTHKRIYLHSFNFTYHLMPCMPAQNCHLWSLQLHSPCRVAPWAHGKADGRHSCDLRPGVCWGLYISWGLSGSKHIKIHSGMHSWR